MLKLTLKKNQYLSILMAKKRAWLQKYVDTFVCQYFYAECYKSIINKLIKIKV